MDIERLRQVNEEVAFKEYKRKIKDSKIFLEEES